MPLISDGDCTVQLFPEVGLAGETLAWRGVLHQRPVPEVLNLEAPPAVRARYLGDAIFWQYLPDMACLPQPPTTRAPDGGGDRRRPRFRR